MIKSKKIENLDKLTEKLKKAKSVILTDYAGLKVDQISQLRKDIKKAGGDYEVVKNTLLKLAASREKLPLGEADVAGPTAALWLFSEDITPLKLLKAFIKKVELPKITLGFWDNQPITTDRIDQLANLPTIDQLRANLVGTVGRPLYGLVNSLQFNLRALSSLKRRSGSGLKKGVRLYGRR